MVSTAPAVSKAKQSVPFSVLFCPSHVNVEWCPAGRYQHYLESVLEGADEFHEIGDLILRHATLAATNQDLKEQRNHFERPQSRPGQNLFVSLSGAVYACERSDNLQYTCHCSPPPHCSMTCIHYLQKLLYKGQSKSCQA